ncbi:Cell-division-associated, ABC-transporter-like signaling protein FtsX [Olavius algarvensis associated proteobacterium Delta 3]|nr:Cell-division-associated, ABC-transporter-like signaling protein FtsX [Olavius algarvensis associated proteobacterium Delta 3]CAB5142710.1 Cell-division-associated, ABC-transporter-like signaling protein FtsX [Olavius algarvensis associated proteobacterium Delta 3]
MKRYYRRAIQDLLSNRFLNSITVVTISLSILILSAFALFLANVGDLVNIWRQGVRMMVYLQPDLQRDRIPGLRAEIQNMYGVAEVSFIPKEAALERLRNQMQRQSSIIVGLDHNPLPDAFELRMIPTTQTGGKMETLAKELEQLPEVEEVEYGQQWIGRLTSVFNLFRLAGSALGALFFMAAVFIVANTIRLLIYARREEVEIMRLVGATDGFIKAPFYIEGMILGALGGVIGLGSLFLMYLAVSSNVEASLTGDSFTLRFLPPEMVGAILLGSIIVGWFGCYLSLKQFMKT